MKISGKRAFITGAASGIGKETALVLAQAGADVLATDISREALAGLEAQAARENLAIRTAQLDVTNRTMRRWQQVFIRQVRCHISP
jgi:NAD(P)-dependent dehydrogenase (short-subunit alcohol dehydrogenase family)